MKKYQVKNNSKRAIHIGGHLINCDNQPVICALSGMDLKVAEALSNFGLSIEELVPKAPKVKDETQPKKKPGRKPKAKVEVKDG